MLWSRFDGQITGVNVERSYWWHAHNMCDGGREEGRTTRRRNQLLIYKERGAVRENKKNAKTKMQKPKEDEVTKM